MNERIRELAEQANNAIGGNAFSMARYNEKFAELIVWDCLDQIESQRSSGENSDQWTITRDLCYHNMMAVLKQHFGVEE